jgi:hypothetical protein
MTHRINPGDFLDSGQQLVSQNGRYVLQMQTDGNVVVRMTGNIPIWATGTDGNPGAILKMQNDGNLVVIAPGNHPVWASKTNGHQSCVLFMQDDGNAVVVAQGNNPVFASNSATPDSFWEEVKIEMSAAAHARAMARPEAASMTAPAAGAVVGGEVIVCTSPPTNIFICVGVAIAIAVFIEFANGDPPFGPSNDIRVIGGRISTEAKNAGGKLSKAAKEAGNDISKVFKRFF